jgi:hypothetical protein
MKYFLSLVLALSVVLVSCKKEAEVTNTNSTRTPVVPFTEVGNQMKLQQQTTVANTTSTNTPIKSPGLNPAHGQPGHLCELPVGAPLNSAPTPSKTAISTVTPTATTTVTNNASPTVTNLPVANPTTPTPEGMNPPHGQTNHRCDIAVGAPLPK